MSGFTLIEMLIYTAIFSVVSIFLLNILTTVTRSQLRQASSGEVNQQISFVASTIQRLVRSASLIENPDGIPTSTLSLRMSKSSQDRTLVYVDPSSTAIYMQEIPDGSQSGTPIALTSDKVNVGEFSVTKFENPGGTAMVQVDLTLNYVTSNPQAQVARAWQSGGARISAATFDSALLPNANNVSDIGASLLRWKNLYLSGSASLQGALGVGVDAPSAPTMIKTTGNIGFSSSGSGLVLVAPNGSCFKLGISNAGVVTTSSIACP